MLPPDFWEFTFCPWAADWRYLGPPQSFVVPSTVDKSLLDRLTFWGGRGTDGSWLSLARLLLDDFMGLTVATRVSEGVNYIDLGQFETDASSPRKINTSGRLVLELLYLLGACEPDGRLLLPVGRVVPESRKP
jgi:hypothetical protein